MLSAAEPAAGSTLFTKRLRDTIGFPYFGKGIKDLHIYMHKNKEGNPRLQSGWENEMKRLELWCHGTGVAYPRDPRERMEN